MKPLLSARISFMTTYKGLRALRLQQINKMKKELGDYLHLYLGCEVRVQKKLGANEPLVKGFICEVTKQSNHGDWVMVYFTSCVDFIYHNGDKRFSNQHTFFIEEDIIKLVLRPLSDITDEEMKMVNITDRDYLLANLDCGNELNCTTEQFRYLISQSFDLFGLIKAGLAIDSTTFKTF